MSTVHFYTVTIGFLVGVFCASKLGLSWPFALMLVMSVGVIVVLWRLDAAVTRRVCLCTVLGLCAVSLGTVRVWIGAVNEAVPATVPENTVELGGMIEREVEHTGTGQHVVLRVRSASHESLVQEKIRITLPAQPRYTYGDTLTLTGEIRPPESFITETGREFDYEGYLARQGMYYTMVYPEVTRRGSNEGNPAFKALLNLKHGLLGGIRRVLPDPQAALAGGILLGVEQSLGEDLEEAFRTTGLIHIVVLSGYNVTIVAIALMAVLARVGVGYRMRAVVGILGIAVFALAVGLGATVVRASVMAAIVILAHSLGRRGDMLRALALAAVIMVAVNPLTLTADPSFQLSAVATLGLMLLSPPIERLLGWLPTAGGLREIVTATVATQVAVLPILVYLIGMVSLVSVPVNVLALPAVAPAMLFSFLAGVVGVVSGVVALPITAIAYGLLSYMLGVVRWFDALAFSHIVVPPFGIWVPVVLYVLLGLAVVWYYRGRKLEFGIPSLSERLSDNT